MKKHAAQKYQYLEINDLKFIQKVCSIPVGNRISSQKCIKFGFFYMG